MRSAWISSLFFVVICSSASSAQVPLKPAGKTDAAHASRIHFAPAVQAVIESNTPEGALARAWVRYVQGLTGEAGVQLEDVVTADVHCVELEAAGYPPGIAGLRQFREQINTGLPDESGLVTQMRFSGPGMIETELHVTGTHLGELMGHPATGRTVRFVIHTLGRFKGDRLVERWDRTDFAGLLRRLDSSPK